MKNTQIIKLESKIQNIQQLIDNLKQKVNKYQTTLLTLAQQLNEIKFKNIKPNIK